MVKKIVAGAVVIAGVWVAACVGDSSTADTSGGDGGGGDGSPASNADGSNPSASDAGADAACEKCGGSSCIDLSTTAAHCGACQIACGAGDTCNAGHCGKTIRQVAGGGASGYALTWGGALYGWGGNQFGELGVDPSSTTGPCTVPILPLGTGAFACRSTPALVPGISNATSVCAGDEFACALDASGAAWCWGVNDAGELGHAQNDATAGDVNCVGPSGGAGKKPFCNHVPTKVKVAPGVTFTRITCGSHHVCAGDATGAIRCWGSNQSGELGIDPATTSSASPVLVPTLNASQISAGDSFTCVLTTGASTVTCFGANDVGQLGGATPADRTFASAIKATAVSAGENHACALTVNNGVQCWGDNTRAQTGQPAGSSTQAPAKVGMGLPADIVAVAATGDSYWNSPFSMALTSSGSVFAWGDDKFYETLSPGTGDPFCEVDGGFLPCTPKPQQITVPGVTSIAATHLGGIALKDDGTVWAWGGNIHGECGSDPGTPNCNDKKSPAHSSSCAGFPQQVPQLPPP